MGEFVEDANVAGQALLRLTSRGAAVVAEMLRMMQHVPVPFLEPGSDSWKKVPSGDWERFQPILFDFSYLDGPDEFEKRIAEKEQLQALDEEFRENNLDLLNRFYQLFNSIHKYYEDLCEYLYEVEKGTFVQYTFDVMLLDADAKQLLAEAIYLYGVILLLLDKLMPGYSRERMLVSLYRYRGTGYTRNLENVIRLCRSTGLSQKPGAKRPENYPVDYFARFPLQAELIRKLVGRLRSEDIYNQTAIYTNPDQRSFALSTQGAMLFTLLNFAPSILDAEFAIMREIADKYFGDNWIISVYMGYTVNLEVWWKPFDAARTALSNILHKKLYLVLSERYASLHTTAAGKLKEYLKEGALTHDTVLEHRAALMSDLKDFNTTLRWLLLHATYPNKNLSPRLQKEVTPSDILFLALNTAQFELKLRGLIQELLAVREQRWSTCKERAESHMKELSEYFTGEKALTRVAKDDALVSWFADMSSKISALDYHNVTVAARRINVILSALDNVEEFHQIDSSLQIKHYLKETKDDLALMIRIASLQESILGDFSVVADITYGWQLLQQEPYRTEIHQSIRKDPRICLLLRALFLKLVSIMDIPLIRLNQCGSDDVVSVAAYYSSNLVEFIRDVLEVIPNSVFHIFKGIIELLTHKVSPIPMKLERADLGKFAQHDIRYQLAKATHAVSVFTEAVLSMETSFIGMVSVDPKDLLEQGLRKELVHHIASLLHRGLELSEKVVDPEYLVEKLQTLATQLAGYRIAMEYIQDYVQLYGLRMWNEELRRVVFFNVEQEANLFLRHKIHPYESVYQSTSTPVPTFARSMQNAGFHTFFGCLMAHTMQLTDARSSFYSQKHSGWIVNGSVFGDRALFALIGEAMGVYGLVGMDRLVAFKATSALRSTLRIIRACSMIEDVELNLNSLLRTTVPMAQCLEQPSKVYASAQGALSRVTNYNKCVYAICSVGQLQLLRLQIENQLSFTSKVDAKLVVGTVKALNDAMLLQLRHTQGAGSIDASFLRELSSFLERVGMSDPLHAIYVTSPALPRLTIILFLILLNEKSRLRWCLKTPKTPKKRKDTYDATPFLLGIVTLLRQCHPSHTTNLIAMLCQYMRSAATSAHPTNVISRITLQLCEYLGIPKSSLESQVPLSLLNQGPDMEA